MQTHLENVKRDQFANTQQYLKQYQNMKEPRDVFLMYRYSSKYDHDYERITNEVIKEYRAGMLDPARVVGKVEKTRGKVRK